MPYKPVNFYSKHLLNLFSYLVYKMAKITIRPSVQLRYGGSRDRVPGGRQAMLTVDDMVTGLGSGHKLFLLNLTRL